MAQILKLSPGAIAFAKALAAKTGLNTRVVQAWIANEEGTRTSPQGHADHNWLNVGWTGNGPVQATRLSAWKTPQGAAALTAAWMQGRGPVAQMWAPATTQIQAILKTSGGSPDAQMKAITSSGWASAGEASLRSLYAQTQGLHNIKPPQPRPVVLGPLATPKPPVPLTNDHGLAIRNFLSNSKAF